MAEGRIIVITGGTGSFGVAATRRLLAAGAREVRILSRDPARQTDLRRRFDDPRVRFVAGDVGDYRSIEAAVRGADHVIHAAAQKLVPYCEQHPEEAVATNVLGSGNVIRACRSHGVRSVVCTSTDKAVHPAGVMGMSKALMEKVAAAHARHDPAGTVISVVRYGNLLFSQGTVVPLFIEQLRAGQPLTVTDPRMTRFLMSLTESVDLAMHALANARSGDLFVRKAPAATIEDLARAVALLLGVDPQIRVIGPRPGEKRHETMLSREELAVAVDEGDSLRVPLDAAVGALPERDFTSENATRLDVEQTAALLGALPQMRESLP